MNTRRNGVLGVLLCGFLSGLLSAQTLQPESLREKQETQKRVRKMAHDLVGGALDIQLLQLEENGLDNLSLYRDIREMRGHLDELVEAAMPQVVELLTKIENSPVKEREKHFMAARRKSREVLATLILQRQQLLRRLRIAEMAAQVQRLIALEGKILTTTESLPEQAQASRESLTLATIEDQRDIKTVYLGLKEMLRETETWGGQIGAEATRGLELLKTGRVDEALDDSTRNLQATKYADAAESQRSVVRGLLSLLEIIERVQGLMREEQQSAQEIIRKLAERQEELRKATSQPDLTQQQAEQLVQKQSEIRNEIAKLAEQLQPTAAEQAVKQAEQAAQEATADLFENKPQEAVAEQQKVLDNLAAAAREVQQKQEKTPAEDSKLATEPSRQIEDLAKTKADLEGIEQKQEAAAAAAKNNPAEAKRQENQVAQDLKAVPKDRELPEKVATSVAQAEQAAQKAAGQMDAAAAEKRVEAADDAKQAIQQAIAETDRALADAQRQQLAELAAPQQGKTPEERQTAEQAIGQRLQRLAQAEEKVREATAEQERAAGRPEVARAMELARDLERALKLQDQADRATKPSDVSGQRPSEAVSKQQEVAKLAGDLAKRAAEVGQQPSQDPSQSQPQKANEPLSSPLAQTLAQAERAAREAAKELAEAKPAEAQTAQKETRQALEQAREMVSSEAQRAAEAPKGVPNPEAQQRVGQAVAEAQALAQPDAPEAAETLERAEEASGQAQQQTAQEKAEEAAKSQQTTGNLLAQAAEQLEQAMEQLAQEAAQQPSTKADRMAPPQRQAAQNQSGEPLDQQLDSPPNVPGSQGKTGLNPSPQGVGVSSEGKPEERRATEEPWIMNLPPELRGAIRASAEHRPPRGYEDKLERYFKNID
jgi:hypothetical protein